MKISTIEYFIREALVSLRLNSLMSIAAISTVALSLIVLGIFLIIALNLNHIAANLEGQLQVSVYLKDELTDLETREIGTQITKIPGVTQVFFVDKETALERFKDRLGEQQSMLAALDESNPLPNSFEVKVDKPEQVEPATEIITNFEGIESVNFGKEIVDKLVSVIRLVRILGLALIIFLGLVTLFIISNTIRITVFARRKEIGIMKYVGATDWFIRWPFLIEGMLIGFAGSLFAVVVLNRTYIAILETIYDSLAFLPLIPKYPFLTNISIFLIVIGMATGALGSTISLKRFMKV
ncbi:MAG: permease-like cell division protein FtsX [Sporomusaceae bacterium]|jgi:cell division transport system permease protein|nr:permease-like cell division protein FtsX [Sporomusaceae bacterium]